MNVNDLVAAVIVRASKSHRLVIEQLVRKAEKRIGEAWLAAYKRAIASYLEWFRSGAIMAQPEDEAQYAVEIINNETAGWYEDVLREHLDTTVKLYAISKHWIVEQANGEKVVRTNRDAIEEILSKIQTVAYALPELGKTTSIDLAMTDERAIGWLLRDSNYWITEGGIKQGYEVGKSIRDVVQAGLEDGLGRVAIGDMLEFQLGATFARTEAYWELVASAGLVRSASFGAISGLESASIAYYEWFAMGDDRMCPICSQLDGQIFPVSTATKTRDAMLATDDPEKAKEIMPWITLKQLEAAASPQELGVVAPPIHGNCRCAIVLS